MTPEKPQDHLPDKATHEAIGKALGRIPQGLFVLTAAYEDKRSGMLASWVQQVCFQPPMVCVAVAKGRSIMPLVSESRRFGLCQLVQGDRVMQRKFTGHIDPNDDIFLGYDLVQGKFPDLPLPANALTFLECELACHMDVEGDHDLFIGHIVNGGLLREGEPQVHIRDSGFHY